ncbi:MAG: CsgG/HfaB family protein [Planctomycetota bacterium]
MGDSAIKERRRWAALALLAALALAGCTSTVTYVRIREPLEKDRISNVKVVAVMPFRNLSGDTGAAGIVGSAVRAGIQDSFTVVERQNVEKLAMERALHESDLIDPNTRQKLRLTGADTAIVGEVSKYEHHERRGYENVQVPVTEQHVVWRDGRRSTVSVVRMQTVRKPYLRVTATASAAIHVVDLSNGTTLVSHAATLSARDQGGGAGRKSIGSVQGGNEMLNGLTQQIIHAFLAKIVRSRVEERRVLDKYWGDGVNAAKNGDWKIASKYFWARYLKDEDSAEALNNIAVCIEATAENDPAKLRKAIELYEKALELDYENLYSANLRRAQAVLDDVLRAAKAH